MDEHTLLHTHFFEDFEYDDESNDSLRLRRDQDYSTDLFSLLHFFSARHTTPKAKKSVTEAQEKHDFVDSFILISSIHIPPQGNPIIIIMNHNRIKPTTHPKYLQIPVCTYSTKTLPTSGSDPIQHSNENENAEK